MAWVLIGVAGAAVIYEIASEMFSDAYRRTTQPIRNYFEARANNAEIDAREAVRQQHVEQAKRRHQKNVERFSQYTHAVHQGIITIINNTEIVGQVLYVNRDREPTPQAALQWAQRAMQVDLLHRTNTVITTLGVDNQVELIAMERQEYTIILHCNGRWKALNDDDYAATPIMVKSVLEMQEVPDVEVQCSKWLS